MKRNSIGILGFAALASIAAGAARADYLDQTINTTSLATADYDDISQSAGPYPFNNFGVQGQAGLGAGVSASVNGSTEFKFPSIAAGQTFTANQSVLKYDYTPSWTGGSVGSHAGLSASAGFVYDIGPFSGNVPIYDTALNAHASGNIGGGTTLSGSSANGSAAGQGFNFHLTESALFASATAGLNVGLNLQTAISYSPTVQYGYYTWTNTTGLLSAADTLTWHGVQSGDLTYAFGSNIGADIGAQDFFLNFLPGVQMQMPISPTTTVTIPLTGYLNVSAFGDTLVDESLSLGDLYSLTENYETWNDNVNWNGGGYYSLDLHQDNSQCQIHVSPTCEVYQVIGDHPLFANQVQLPSNTTQDSTGGSAIGGWDPALDTPALVPDACDPSTGICYASNDPNMPTGPGSVTYTDTPTGAPEPWSLALLGGGLIGFGLLRRRQRGLSSFRPAGMLLR